MEITAIRAGGRMAIEGYGPDGFRVSGQFYPGATLVFPDRCAAWPVTAIDTLCLDDLADVRVLSPPADLLLIGTGPTLRRLPPAVAVALRADGLAIDVMPTGGACRTHGILLSEHRRVVAALLPA